MIILIIEHDLADNDAAIRPKYLAGHSQPSNGFPASSAILQSLGGTHRVMLKLTRIQAFLNPNFIMSSCIIIRSTNLFTWVLLDWFLQPIHCFMIIHFPHPFNGRVF